MKISKCWLAVLIAGLVASGLDCIVQGQLINNAYYAKMESFKHDTAMGWYIFGDFIAVAVFAWVYGKVASVFGEGLKGGACAGFTLGVFATFPAYHFVCMTTKGYPYALAWINTGYGIVWYMVIGAIVGAIMKKPAAAAPAA